jgi:hypothetical protein
MDRMLIIKARSWYPGASAPIKNYLPLGGIKKKILLATKTFTQSIGYVSG